MTNDTRPQISGRLIRFSPSPLVPSQLQKRATLFRSATKRSSTMEATLRSSVPPFAASPPHRLCTTTCCGFNASGHFAHSSLHRKQHLCLPPRTRRTTPQPLGFSVPRSSITCGFVQEINEAQFENTVLKSDLPVLVEFVASWCGPCRLISPAIESLAQEYEDRLTVVKIDHDLNPKLIEEYKVYGLPALILFKNGKEVPESRREGAITKAKLREHVDALLESTSVA